MGSDSSDNQDDKTCDLKIEGMTCQHCADTVQKALEKVSGVKSVMVDLAGGRAEVSFAGEIGLENLLIDAVNDAGYKGSV